MLIRTTELASTLNPYRDPTIQQRVHELALAIGHARSRQQVERLVDRLYMVRHGRPQRPGDQHCFRCRRGDPC